MDGLAFLDALAARPDRNRIPGHPDVGGSGGPPLEHAPGVVAVLQKPFERDGAAGAHACTAGDVGGRCSG